MRFFQFSCDFTEIFANFDSLSRICNIFGRSLSAYHTPESFHLLVYDTRNMHEHFPLNISHAESAHFLDYGTYMESEHFPIYIWSIECESKFANISQNRDKNRKYFNGVKFMKKSRVQKSHVNL